MKKVLVESPFAGRGDTEDEITADREANVTYARRCLNDSFQRGEAPFASHLLYPQPGILDDDVYAERQLGIEAGLLWGREASMTVIYLDRGFSGGMAQGVERALDEGRDFELRAHPEYAGSSPIIDAYISYIHFKGWDELPPQTEGEWVKDIHKTLLRGARSSDMGIVPFLKMLNERDWFAR